MFFREGCKNGTEPEGWYGEKSCIIREFKIQEKWYVSLVMEILILTLATYLITKKRLQRFEWTIVVCMLLKYALFATLAVKSSQDWIYY